MSERVTNEGSVERLANEQLVALENELQGVYLDPGYGCPRVEYGSIFRYILAARSERDAAVAFINTIDLLATDWVERAAPTTPYAAGVNDGFSRASRDVAAAIAAYRARPR